MRPSGDAVSGLSKPKDLNPTGMVAHTPTLDDAHTYECVVMFTGSTMLGECMCIRQYVGYMVACALLRLDTHAHALMYVFMFNVLPEPSLEG